MRLATLKRLATLARQAAGCIAVAALASAATASDFDGSKRLICATVEARDCVSGSSCLNGIPDEIGAPAFMRIDFDRKVIVGPQRTTAIQILERSDRQVLLLGTELGYGWALALDRTTGRFSGSLADAGGVFVLLGSCTPL
jgi:hypothetical protein